MLKTKPSTRLSPPISPLSAAAPNTPQRGIQSMEVGGQLLLALTQHGSPMALKDLAQDAGMAPAKAHPYLVSFNKLGLIVQDEASGKYGLGPLAMQLGLISLQQYDPVRLATPLLADLAKQLGHTVAIAVWGNRGPTIVRVEDSPNLVHVTMRHGTVMSLRNTASGRLFAAHLPQSVVLQALEQERSYEQRHGNATSRSITNSSKSRDAQFLKSLNAVRQNGISAAEGLIVPGINALAAPVFNQSGQIALSLTTIGASALLDVNLKGNIATTLCGVARSLSERLGFRGN
ncbi:MAG TPA: IclR family transcriptional regulator [Burkholderiaceae bacterium]|nr:IclR family transcriptional regulator [Burkholderiaceae bacterium]